jgi:hypothetical protein
MPVSLGQFFAKQFIDVIQWNEPEDGVLAYRYPMQDMEIQNGGQLTVRESQVAVFVDQGKIADVFGPGLHTLNTRNLPILTDLKNWPSDRSEMGHGESHHHPRQGIWRSPPARLRHLLLADRRSPTLLHRGIRHSRDLLHVGS